MKLTEIAVSIKQNGNDFCIPICLLGPLYLTYLLLRRSTVSYPNFRQVLIKSLFC